MARHVDAEEVIPVFEGHLHQRMPFDVLVDRSIVDQDVDTAEGIVHRRGHRSDLGLAGDVGPNEGSQAAGRPNLLTDLLALLDLAINHCDPGALGR